MLELKSLTKIYSSKVGGIKAVNRINLKVKTGHICVLLGPSGCGKTTTLRMVNRLIEPSSGKILINGEDVVSYKIKDLRRNIGYVIQNIGLFPNMNVYENIIVVPKLLGWKRSEKEERAFELLEMVGLPTTGEFMKRYPFQLSGGQQQRVGVIRAMAGNPKLMLMDEAFGAIDPINRMMIQDEFKAIQKKQRLTVLFVSHDVDEAIKLGDEIAIFNNGRIIQHGTPNQLLQNPNGKFVAEFLGRHRELKRIGLFKTKEVMRRRIKKDEKAPQICYDENLLVAISAIFNSSYDYAVCVDETSQVIGSISTKDIRRFLIENEFE